MGSPQACPSGADLAKLTSAAGNDQVKLILLGDSAVGKSKLVERFLQNNYNAEQLSTYALTLYRHQSTSPDGLVFNVDIWDTAGQARFDSMHASYYFMAHCCILVFDCTRKVTYKNLDKWWNELQSFQPGCPTILVANKIDADPSVTNKSFAFATKHSIPFFFVSASDGTNVVRIFDAAIQAGYQRKACPHKDDFCSEILDLVHELDTKA